jgi:hypothetical protein
VEYELARLRAFSAVGIRKDIEGFATLGFLSQSAALLNLRSSSMKMD